MSGEHGYGGEGSEEDSWTGPVYTTPEWYRLGNSEAPSAPRDPAAQPPAQPDAPGQGAGQGPIPGRANPVSNRRSDRGGRRLGRASRRIRVNRRSGRGSRRIRVSRRSDRASRRSHRTNHRITASRRSPARFLGRTSPPVPADSPDSLKTLHRASPVSHRSGRASSASLGRRPGKARPVPADSPDKDLRDSRSASSPAHSSLTSRGPVSQSSPTSPERSARISPR